MSDLTDTIFARASGAGQGAITVVRLSGPGTASCLLGLCGGLPPPRTASLRRLRDPRSAELLDEGLVIWFPGPRSYTGEDAAELQLHGGAAVLAGIAEALLRLGCRPAEPGEFTRRGFLHGRLDLLQAEAIGDLVGAETTAQRRQALRQADGALSQLYDRWTGQATHLLAQQEAAIEFAMDDLPSDLDRQAQVAARTLLDEVRQHLDDGGRGELVRQGLAVVIVGAPNAGKSSLLNALLNEDAAIVGAEPGTTRDVVERRLILGGVPVMLADTAGLRDSGDAVEQEGVRRARQRGGSADLVVAAFAADQTPDAATLAVVQQARHVLVVLTKCDLATALPSGLRGHATLTTSVRSGIGITALRAELERIAAQRAEGGDAPALTRARHRAALSEAVLRLDEAVETPRPELASEGYRLALQAFGRLTGRIDVEQVLDAVFRDFCIGK